MVKVYWINTRNVALTGLFSAIIFMQKVIFIQMFPAPYDKLFDIFVQVTLLMLGFLIMGSVGTFFISVLSGILLAFVRAEFAFMTLPLSVAYGVLICLSARALKVKSRVPIDLRKLILSSTISSALVGSISMSIILMLGLIPMNLGLIAAIFVGGLVQGAMGGYAAGILWRRYMLVIGS